MEVKNIIGKNKKVKISGESIIQELNERNISLKVFTIDLFGSLGPQAHAYFNEIKKTTNKDRWFGTTYQTTCPSIWDKQTLKMNIKHHLLQTLETIYQQPWRREPKIKSTTS